MPLRLTLVEPDGTEQESVVQEDATLPSRTEAAGVPVQFVFMVNLARQYVQPGTYKFRVAYADLTQDYVYVVEATDAE